MAAGARLAGARDERLTAARGRPHDGQRRTPRRDRPDLRRGPGAAARRARAAARRGARARPRGRRRGHRAADAGRADPTRRSPPAGCSPGRSGTSSRNGSSGRPARRRPCPRASASAPTALLREIGRGGMGVVYLAERADGAVRPAGGAQAHPAGRRDAEAMLRRFGQERQILASLDHPGIARLLDGGVDARGRPYLVHGARRRAADRPLLRRAARCRSTSALRALRTSSRGAVELAHRNLVVHRDLKPSNILVTASRRGEAPRLRHRQAARRRGGEAVRGAAHPRRGCGC